MTTCSHWFILRCTRNKRSKFLKVKQPLVFPMLFICKYLQTYNVYSEIWGGVKKKNWEMRKCVLFIETKIILLNRLEKKCYLAKVSVDFFLYVLPFWIMLMLPDTRSLNTAATTEKCEIYYWEKHFFLDLCMYGAACEGKFNWTLEDAAGQIS